jgi:hypothetical protein
MGLTFHSNVTQAASGRSQGLGNLVPEVIFLEPSCGARPLDSHPVTQHPPLQPPDVTPCVLRMSSPLPPAEGKPATGAAWLCRDATCYCASNRLDCCDGCAHTLILRVESACMKGDLYCASKHLTLS